MSNLIEDESKNPYAFIQWKGTNVCMDFHCDCGAHCHYDGYFAYVVQCPHCGAKWEMPELVKPRRVNEKAYAYWVENPKVLERDEDL